MNFSEKVISFLSSVNIPGGLPEGVEVLDPYSDPVAMDLTQKFFRKFYNDEKPRIFLIGINPGRFGGGATGIAFTDPVNLEQECGIINDLDKRQELSSRFIYKMIGELGDVSNFYSSFFFTSVSPLGFIKDRKNLNYYDIPELQEMLEPFMVDCLRKQISFGASDIAFSLGQGKNIAYLRYLNKKYELFSEIKPLPHPRWIMQYRLKRLEEFLELYKTELSLAMQAQFGA